VPQYVDALDGETLSPAAPLTRLKEIGGSHDIGRLDLVKNRFVGMEPRGVSETPGGMILQATYSGIENLTLDRGAAHLKNELTPSFAELIYNGFSFSPVLSVGVRRRAYTASATLSSRRTRCTTSATPTASSGATRCACASPPDRIMVKSNPLLPCARALRG
jgi:hypothetical protein